MDVGHEDRWLKVLLVKYPHKQLGLSPPNCHYIYTEGRLSVRVKCPTQVEKRKCNTCRFEKCRLDDVSIHCISTDTRAKRLRMRKVSIFNN